MPTPNPVPLDAYSTTYDTFATSPIAADDNLRQGAAERVVAVLMRLRRERGLDYLRGIGGLDRFNNALRIELEEFSVDSTAIVSRGALKLAYVRTAEVIITAFARPKS